MQRIWSVVIILLIVLVQTQKVVRAGAAAEKGTFGYELVQGDLAAIKIRFEKDPQLVNVKNEYGISPLWAAAAAGRLEVVQYLVSIGADLNKSTDRNGVTPLMVTMGGRRLDIAEFLLSKGADVNAQDNSGDTALHSAARMSYVEGAKFLLSHGANVNALNKKGVTPLHNAIRAEFFSLEIVQALLDNGANVDLRDNNGATPKSLVADIPRSMQKYPGLLTMMKTKAISISSDKPANPTAENSSISSEKPVSPLVETSLIPPEKPANPTAENSSVPSGKPVSPLVETASIATERPISPIVKADEILLRGWVQSIDSGNGQLTLVITGFQLPNGRSAQLSTPKTKVALLNEDTKLFLVENGFSRDASFDVGLLHRQVSLVGPDAGSGSTLIVRAAFFGDLIKDVKIPTGTTFPAFPVVSSSHIFPSLGAQPQRKPFTAPPITSYYGGVHQWVAASGIRVGAKFGIKSIGGRASRPGNYSDHPRGLALDFMVFRNAALGNSVAAYFVKNARAENVKYVIWKDNIWQGGDPYDWSSFPVDYTGDYTKRHMDHVHVSYLSEPNTSGPWLSNSQILASRKGRRPSKTTHTKKR